MVLRNLILMSLILVPAAAMAQTETDDNRAVRVATEAMDHWRAGRMDQAENGFVEAIMLSGRNASILNVYASFLVAQKRYSLAEMIARKSIEVDATKAEYQLRLGDALQGADRLRDAETAYTRAIQLDPVSTHYEKRGMVRDAQSRYADATLDFEAAVAAGGGAKDLVWLAYVLEKQDRFSEAVDAARRALSLGDTQPITHSILGLALYYLDQLAEALAEMTEALRLSPNDAAFASNLTQMRNHTLPARTPRVGAAAYASSSPMTTSSGNASQRSQSAATQNAAAETRATESTVAQTAGTASFGSASCTLQGGYLTINVRFGQGTLTVVEPDKTSVYSEVSPGEFHFTNPTNGIRYGMRRIDNNTLEAFKPGTNSPPTRFICSGNAAASAGNSAYLAAADRYKALTQSDPDNVQTWAACAAAAYARATQTDAQFRNYALQVAQSLKPIMVDPTSTPCSDAIPADIWARAGS